MRSSAASDVYKRQEYVFSGTPGALADCRLAGDFYIAGLLTEGSWKVTFRLEGGA